MSFGLHADLSSPMRKMNVLKLVYVIALLAVFTRSFAGGNITVSGYLLDASSGESLVGGVIEVAGAGIQTASNNYGFFSLTVPAGRHTLCFSYVGYQRIEKTMNLGTDTVFNVNMEVQMHFMNEVVVSTGGKNGNIDKPVAASPLTINSVKLLPPLLGESDLIKSFQLLPGVSTIGDGTGGFNVRGGGTGQNLVLMDEAPLFFTSHLFNLFSVANPDAMKDAALFKTEMPARFGGRLSSVLDTRMKDGNNKDWNVAGGLGLIASRITAEGPLKKNRSSVIVSGRRSYSDLITKHFSDPDIRDNSIYFYDLSTKLNLQLSQKDHLFASGYFGKDKIVAARLFKLQWGNGTGTLRWNHIFSPTLFLNTAYIYSDYNYRLGYSNNPTSSYIWRARIDNHSLKYNFSWYPGAKNTVYFGLETTLYNFSPGRAAPDGSASLFNPVEIPGQRAAEYNLYWDHEVSFSSILAAEYGLRYSAFQSLAKGSVTVFDYQGPAGQRKEAVNPRDFTNGKIIRTYYTLQPRMSLKIKVAGEASAKLSYSRTVQNLHLISNTISVSPLDMWAPSSYNIKPELADQFSAGYFSNLKDNDYEVSAELYYRRLYNQIDFIDGAETVLNENLYADMLSGKGRAYGSEFFIKKNSGVINGWISYTLSRAEKKINGINNDSYFPASYDKTHSLAIVAMWKANQRLTVSGTYTFATGTPATLPEGRYEFAGYPVQYNPGNYRNNYRIPSYRRLDLSATLKGRITPGKKFNSEWVFSLFNALNRRNTFSIYLRQKSESPSELEAVRFAMFGTVIPSITWNFKF